MSSKPERPPCPECTRDTGATEFDGEEAPVGSLWCIECGHEWPATDAEIMQATAAEKRIAAETTEADDDSDTANDCGTCGGHGIGRTGDPDTSRGGDCGGTGVAKRTRDEDDR